MDMAWRLYIQRLQLPQNTSPIPVTVLHAHHEEHIACGIDSCVKVLACARFACTILNHARLEVAPMVVLARHQPLVDGEVEIHIEAGVGGAVLQATVPHLPQPRQMHLLRLLRG